MRSTPRVCSEEEKPKLEAANALEQLEYLRYVVVDQQRRQIRKHDVLELQRLAVTGIYPCAGQLRTALFRVEVPGSGHVPPAADAVDRHLQELLDVLNDARIPALRRSAIALWRFNWLHPFPGGNGRTARALSYVVLCMDLGRMLPGVPTIPSLISGRRDDYIDALRAVDAAVLSLPDDSLYSLLEKPSLLAPMETFMSGVAFPQLAAGLSSELLRSPHYSTRFLGAVIAAILRVTEDRKH